MLKRFVVLSAVAMLMAGAHTAQAATKTLDPVALTAAELGVSESDAKRYLDSLTEAIAVITANGFRIAIDGLGAFERAFQAVPDSDVVLHTLSFRFDLGRALDHPCMPTLFDDSLARQTVAQDAYTVARLPRELAAKAEPLDIDGATKLVDIVVFAILYNTDQNNVARIGSRFGEFVGGVSLVAPAQDYNSSRSNKANSIAADLSDNVINDAEDVFIQIHAGTPPRRPNLRRVVQTIRTANAFIDQVLQLMIATHREQNPDDNRPNSRLVISDEIIGDVANDVIAAAQDHNASRSNKTSAIVNNFTGELVGEAVKLALAQDYNSSRSNKANSIAAGFIDDLDDAIDVEIKAQDYNSSRSNKARGIAADFSDDIIGDIEDVLLEAIQKAQDYNSSRSNKARGVFGDIVDDFRGDLLNILFTAKAQDYNSSRSNKARGIANNFMDGIIRLMWTSQISDDYNNGNSTGRLQPGTIIDVAGEVMAGAQDHNASRSNKTSAIIIIFTGELTEEATALALAQDHNASRSNKTRVIVDRNLPRVYDALIEDLILAGFPVGGPNPDAQEFKAFVDAYFTRNPAAPAQDHNASRSNRTAASPYYEDLRGAYGAPKAQDYNSSRSNKARGIAIDFSPSNDLINYLNQ